ncbi:unnamed protein product [Cyprideis torosa]|uniref:Uncharacterized protein n=1 Tax=Cyprideis torosa TaxID=163714 RepID=A0A7R8ZRL1_9CRUS|nr:unnamed protein product [Cyprideis torosa]CAG0893434.1 unnamed protein product [Cyprideis torosa]
MSFFTSKKRFKFKVELTLEEMTAVSFARSVFFAKIRLLSGGNFQEFSSREEVRDHSVKWGTKFTFNVKLSANASTGILDPCVLKISVRKESKGGRTYDRMGYVHVNLAELAGTGKAFRRYLLEAYDSKTKLDNSTLNVTLQMNLLSGDPCFKRPSPSRTPLADKFTGEGKDVSPSSSSHTLKGPMHRSGPGHVSPDSSPIIPSSHPSDCGMDTSVASSSGCGSLPKLGKPSFLTTTELLSGTSSGFVDTFQYAMDLGPSAAVRSLSEAPSASGNTALGHSRHSSNTSHASAGYGSLPSQHSRHSSSGESALQGHQRKTSSGSSVQSNPTGSVERKNRERTTGTLLEDESSKRIGNTRVNPETVIEGLMERVGITAEEENGSRETGGLKLYVRPDGSTALGAKELQSKGLSGANFKAVIIEDR